MKKSNNGYICPKFKNPWEDSFGNFLPMAEIKKRSRKWSPEIWERYLKTVESYQREMLCDDFDSVCDKHQSEVALQQMGNDGPDKSIQDGPAGNRSSRGNQLTKEEITSLIHNLTPVEALVVRCLFWHAYTEEELARPLRRKQSTINKIKKRALMKLRRHAAVPAVTGEDGIHSENTCQHSEIDEETINLQEEKSPDLHR